MRRAFPAAISVLILLAPGAARAANADPVPPEQVVLSGDVVVERGTSAGEVVVFHGSATILGVAEGDVVVLDGPIVVAGQVHGDVVALGGDVRLRASAQIAGGVMASGEVLRAEGASVGGPIRQGMRVTLSASVGALGDLLAPIAIAVSMLVTALLLLLIAPRGAERVARAARSAPFASAGWGIGLAVLAPLGAVAATATILGIPLGLALLLALGLLWLLGLAWASWIVGRLLVHEPRSRLLALGAGWAIVAALGLVPIVNVACWALASLFGLGAATVAIWRARGTSRHRIGAASPGVDGA
jgi:hypothetical protein